MSIVPLDCEYEVIYLLCPPILRQFRTPILFKTSLFTFFLYLNALPRDALVSFFLQYKLSGVCDIRISQLEPFYSRFKLQFEVVTSFVTAIVFAGVWNSQLKLEFKIVAQINV